MSEYVLFTDSSADLSAEMVHTLGLTVLPLSFTMQNKTYHNYPDNREMDPKVFYDMLRGGEMCTTAAVNVGNYTEAVEPVLRAGKDALLLAFSSGLSATYQSASLAAKELAEKYPERKVFAVDTLCASLGQGLLAWHAVQKKNAGATIEELRDWLEGNKMNVCHWFTVDDLHFLKRGGRVSAATAMVGTMLQIKPLLHVDDEGRLISMAKARGRVASLTALADKLGETVTDKELVSISHGDCLSDAQLLADDLMKRIGVKKVLLNNIGPVIGAHAGPGCVAMFFMGSKR